MKGKNACGKKDMSEEKSKGLPAVHWVKIPHFAVGGVGLDHWSGNLRSCMLRGAAKRRIKKKKKKKISS